MVIIIIKIKLISIASQPLRRPHSMLKQIQLAAHVRLPPYPPSTFMTFFFALNVLLSFITQYATLFRLFSFVYGTLMLYRIHNVQLPLKLTIIINAFVLWAIYTDVSINKYEQCAIFWIFVLMFSKQLIFAGIGVFQALCFMKKVQFDDVYWVIQMGTIAQFFKQYTGMKWLRLAPSTLRIVQNLRVNNKSAYFSALRFVCMFIRQFMPSYSTQWIFMSIIISIWEIYNNYVNQFAMDRVFKHKGICIYPRLAIQYGFYFISFTQWTWVWAGRHSGTFTIVRKVMWNFLRLESRVADLYRKYAVVEIVNLHGIRDLHDIIY